MRAPNNKLVEAAVWFNTLCETSNKAFVPLFADEHRYLVLKGGGGSGKSIFAGRKVIERCVAEAGHRFLVARKVAKTLRESCFEQLVRQAREFYPQDIAKVNQSDMGITFANGSEILFSGMDDPEKIKSIYGLTGIWIEEASELTEADFGQLDIRLRGETQYYKQIILSFNPISALHWLKKRFFDVPDERALTHESTYKDNRFLDDEAKKTLEAFKLTDPYYYQVYCLGQWGVTGKTVFPAELVVERLQADIKPVEQGTFTYNYNGLAVAEISLASDGSNMVRVYKKPIRGIPYVVGVDTAGEGSDYAVAQVLDNTTGKQVATMRGRVDEDVFARQVYCLGRYYNDALVGVETNFSSYTVLELERLRYPKLYVRESVDEYTHRPKNSYGFVTNTKTRPLIVAGLIQAFRDDPTIVSDRATLEEMLTFVRNEQMRPEAEEGAHDDTIMSLAIAHFIRPQQSYTEAAAVYSKNEWTADMKEDYRNASKAEKEMLLRKWGKRTN